MAGVRWRLGQEEARYTFADGQAALGLERGWVLQSSGVENPEEELLCLATSLSCDGTVWRVVGYSVQGRPIEVVRLGNGPDRTLLFGVFHGDEPAGETVLRRLIAYLIKTPSVLSGRSVTICPVLSPDALAAETRVNAHQVDVNRNFPAQNWTSEGEGTRYWGGPQPASEPETRAVMLLLDSFAPSKIVTLHAPLHNVNYDGPAAELAQRMSALNGYKVEPDIGYPTPGSFGTYVGRERGIPTVTLEFPEAGGEAMWLENKEALLEAIGYDVHP
jgi:protein MpaA